MKHFLKLRDFDSETIQNLVQLAVRIKAEPDKWNSVLQGKSVGMLFQKHSTRTRLSFEVGISRLGGQPVLIDSRTTHLNRGESIADSIRVFNGYLNMLMIRTYDQSLLHEWAEYSRIPIINGLTDQYHPCQVVADLLTITEQFSDSKGLRLCFVGDANNVAASLMWACAMAGMEFHLLSPRGYNLPEEEVNAVSAYGLKPQFFHEEPPEALKDCQVVYTDVWASMGQESEQEKRLAEFRNFQVNSGMMAHASDNAIVLHCLPAHKEEEISEEIFEKHADVIFRQAENRLWAQMAIMSWLVRGDFS
jgi:ornithine carbamoyltransferase